MQVRSIYRGARISAFKCRDVTREIQGLPVAQAVDVLKFTPKKAARLVLQTLKSAIANAEHNNKARVDQLMVKEAVVGEGPTLKRFRPKARGSAGPILKRTSHIRIILDDESVPSAKSAKTQKSVPAVKRKTAKPASKAEVANETPENNA